MKKILIITYCTSANPGTLLQAFGVYTALKSIYPKADIDFFKIHRLGKPRFRTYKSLKEFVLITYGRAISFIRNKVYFKWSEKFLHRSELINFGSWDYSDEEYKNILKNYDLISIGSDTVLDTMWYNDRIGVAWGRHDIPSRQIMFAASGDDCQQLLKYPNLFEQIKKNLHNFSFLGLRDNMIKDFFIDEIGIAPQRITLQPDPTYYLPLSTFNLRSSLVNKINKIKGKKALFHFDSSFAYRKDLSKIFKEMGYVLISPEYDPNCDINLKIITPLEWGDLFKYVDVIFTERFHDTVFSLRHCKPVINFDWKEDSVNSKGQSKRTEILSVYGLEEYNIRLSASVCQNVFKNNIKFLIDTFDRTKVNSINNEIIDRSACLLKEIKNNIG